MREMLRQYAGQSRILIKKRLLARATSHKVVFETWLIVLDDLTVAGFTIAGNTYPARAAIGIQRAVGAFSFDYVRAIRQCRARMEYVSATNQLVSERDCPVLLDERAAEIPLHHLTTAATGYTEIENLGLRLADDAAVVPVLTSRELQCSRSCA